MYRTIHARELGTIGGSHVKHTLKSEKKYVSDYGIAKIRIQICQNFEYAYSANTAKHLR